MGVFLYRKCIGVVGKTLLGFYQWDLVHNPGNVQTLQFYTDLAWRGLIENNVMVPYEVFMNNFLNVSEQKGLRS
ncbi:hypothetical protein [Anditalea andensis]|uniref:Uncharacterized protein n=1 Tax=Anditalea andensis TaxID=1048983 RepID=A0A074L439_9BACT|nr:hypothetical protein [Anditalea andensis]KEO75225.1 hypothetical protein EL17_06070 [Anditalea andensis]